MDHQVGIDFPQQDPTHEKQIVSYSRIRTSLPSTYLPATLLDLQTKHNEMQRNATNSV